MSLGLRPCYSRSLLPTCGLVQRHVCSISKANEPVRPQMSWVLQIAAAAIVLFLAPAVLLLFELLKIAAFLFGILFILMVLSS